MLQPDMPTWELPAGTDTVVVDGAADADAAPPVIVRTADAMPANRATVTMARLLRTRLFMAFSYLSMVDDLPTRTSKPSAEPLRKPVFHAVARNYRALRRVLEKGVIAFQK
jgi:hypothetical protein